MLFLFSDDVENYRFFRTVGRATPEVVQSRHSQEKQRKAAKKAKKSGKYIGPVPLPVFLLSILCTVAW